MILSLNSHTIDLSSLSCEFLVNVLEQTTIIVFYILISIIVFFKILDLMAYVKVIGNFESESYNYPFFYIDN